MELAERELRKKYLLHAVERAGGFILPSEQALLLIADIEHSGLTLEGIDGYYIDQKSMGDSSQDSVSFLASDLRADGLSGRTNYEKARNFILAHSQPNVFFDVLFSDTAEVVQ